MKRGFLLLIGAFSFSVVFSQSVKNREYSINKIEHERRANFYPERQANAGPEKNLDYSSPNRKVTAPPFWTEEFDFSTSTYISNPTGGSGTDSLITTNGTWITYGAGPSPNARWEYRSPTTMPDTTLGPRGGCESPGSAPALLPRPGRRINSQSYGNGFWIFDSNYLDGDTVGCGSATGLIPSPHTSYLESPMLDFTGRTNVLMDVSIRGLLFVGTALTVETSTDNGATWCLKRSFPINVSTASNPNPSSQLVDSVDFSEFAGQSGVKIRFNFSGDYYFVQIDDINFSDEVLPGPTVFWEETFDECAGSFLKTNVLGNLYADSIVTSNGTWGNIGISDPQARYEYRTSTSNPAVGDPIRGGCRNPTNPQSLNGQTTTANNGILYFDADYLDAAGGNCGSTPTGTPLAARPFENELISPRIDFSSVTTGMDMQFESFQRLFPSVVITVEMRVDTNAWTPVYTFSTPDQSSYSTTHKFNVSQYSGQQNVQFKIVYQGALYYFAVDDISFVPADFNRISALDYGHKYTPSLYTNQGYGAMAMEAMGTSMDFYTNIENTGAATQTNSVLNLEIVDTAGTTIYTGASSGVSIPAGDTATLVTSVPNPKILFTPNQEYTATYTVTTDSFSTTEGPSESIVFSTTVNEIGRDNGNFNDSYYNGISWLINPVRENFSKLNIAFGHVYEAGYDLGISAVLVKSSDDTTQTGSELTVTLQEYDTAEFSNVSSDLLVTTSTFASEAGPYLVQASDQGNWIEIPFVDFIFGDPVIINVTQGTKFNTIVKLSDLDTFDNNRFELHISDNWSQDSVAIIGLPTTADGRVGEFAWFNSYAPQETGLADASFGIRLKLATINGQNVASSEVTISNTSNVIEVFPNPASERLNLKFANGIKGNFSVQVFDNTGKLVINEEYQSLSGPKGHQMQMDVSGLESGVYNIRMINGDFVQTQKVIIK